jgi:hypothetical protein
MRREIGQGARVEIPRCVEAPHRATVTQAEAIRLDAAVLDINRVTLVSALRQTIHESHRVAFGPAVG